MMHATRAPAPVALLDAYRTLHPADPLRRRLETACERLERLADQIIAELDLAGGDTDIEADADFEDGGDDEPSLGATAAVDQRMWGQDIFSIDARAAGAMQQERPIDRELDTADLEPTLGRSENVDQTAFETGSVHEDEWDLGAANPSPGLSQVHWGQRSLAGIVGGDAEEQCEDEGGACEGEGEDTDTEQPDASDVCPWRSGEVDQRDLGSPFGTTARYVDRGAEWF